MTSSEVPPGHRVGTGKGLVEKQYPGLVDEGLGQFRPLPHALRVAAQRPVHVFRHAHDGQRLFGGRGCFAAAHSRQQGTGADEVVSAHPLIKDVLFGTQTDVPHEGRVVPNAVAKDAYASLAGPELSGGQLQQGRFARSVGAEKPRDAGRNP